MASHRFLRGGLRGLLATSVAMGKALRRAPDSSEQVEQFLSGTGTPLLFVGKVTWVDRGLLPCTVMNTRTTEWSVSRVLYGFDPGKKIAVRFGSCGGCRWRKGMKR